MTKRKGEKAVPGHDGGLYQGDVLDIQRRPDGNLDLTFKGRGTVMQMSADELCRLGWDIAIGRANLGLKAASAQTGERTAYQTLLSIVTALNAGRGTRREQLGMLKSVLKAHGLKYSPDVEDYYSIRIEGEPFGVGLTNFDTQPRRPWLVYDVVPEQGR